MAWLGTPRTIMSVIRGALYLSSLFHILGDERADGEHAASAKRLAVNIVAVFPIGTESYLYTG